MKNYAHTYVHYRTIYNNQNLETDKRIKLWLLTNLYTTQLQENTTIAWMFSLICGIKIKKGMDNMNENELLDVDCRIEVIKRS